MSEPEQKTEDDTESMEDKMAWLRARGVTIDIPSERKAKSAPAQEDQGPPEHTFLYVKVPADVTEPLTQMQGSGKLAADNMLTILKPFFAGGSIDAYSARQQAIAQIGDSGRLLGAQGLSALGEAAQEGVVETFALVRPAKTNNHCGVYIYLDEVGLLKQLPPNPRAGELARACGFDGAAFYGDVYIGRTAVQPPPMRNVDLRVEETSSSADWLRRAATENYDYSLGMRQIHDAIEAKGGAVIGRGKDDGEERTSSDGAYRWSQTDQDVEISVPVPEDTKSKEVKVKFLPRQLVVTVRDTTLDLTLFAPVRPDECNWTLSKGVLSITMEKVSEGRWPSADGG